jgi:hypothetical protein
MKQLILCLLIWAALIALCVWYVPRARACPIYSQSYYRPSYVEKVKIVVAEVFTPVFVPTFAVSYTPPVAAPVAAATAPPPPVASPSAQSAGSDTALILAELRKLSNRLDRLEAGRGGEGQPDRGDRRPPREEAVPDEEPPGKPLPSRLTLKQTRCAACHTKGKLATDVPFAIVEADLSESALTPQQELKMLRYVYKGKCPPPGNKFKIKPLDDTEYAILGGMKVGVR